MSGEKDHPTVKRFEKFTLAIFAIYRYWQRLAEQLCKRADLTVELAGADLSDEDRETFYKALFSIAAHLREISKEGLPQENQEEM